MLLSVSHGLGGLGGLTHWAKNAAHCHLVMRGASNTRQTPLTRL